jgi:hypothetical protein
MPQTSLMDYVDALDKAGLLTRFKDEKRVDELPRLMEGTALSRPVTPFGALLMGHLKKYAETGQAEPAFH